MRQSRKEARLERMMRESVGLDRREAMAVAESLSTEFAGDGNGSQTGDFRNGRRHSPGGRG